MRQISRCVLAAVVVALCAAPAAVAREPDHSGGGSVVAPARGGGLSGAELLAESWTRAFETPADNPNSGGCITLARDVLDWYPGPDGIARCSGTQRTRLFLAFGSVCSSLDPPSFPQGEAEQRACAVAADQGFRALNITVDGGPTVNVVRPRFELISPQGTADLPEGNIAGVDPQTITFVVHAWGAVVRGLRPGLHTVTLEVDNPDFGPPFSFAILLDIRRGGRV